MPNTAGQMQEVMEAHTAVTMVMKNRATIAIPPGLSAEAPSPPQRPGILPVGRAKCIISAGTMKVDQEE